MSSVPAEIKGKKYVSLTSFRKSGIRVATPVWFGEEGDKLYVVSRPEAGKVKRIRNNPRIEVAPCTVGGKVTGSKYPARASILPAERFKFARGTINRKYWTARLSSLWPRKNVYLEIAFD